MDDEDDDNEEENEEEAEESAGTLADGNRGFGSC